MTIHRFKLIFAAFLLTGFQTFLQAQQNNSETLPAMNLDISEPAAMLEPELKGAIKDNKTKITIKSNVSDAQVFLNGQYEGNTTLVINSLPEGHYNMRIEKKGYEPKRYMINVRSGQEQSFYVELEKYEGYVTFKSSPADSSIYVDGSRINSTTVALDEGEHTVSARKFGYESQTSTIYVFRKTYQQVTFELLEAEFQISDFHTNKSSFNPALPGSMGKIRFCFTVSNTGTGTLTVNSQDGTTVFSTELPAFTTWNQAVSWDGTLSDGSKLSEGTYGAVLASGGKTLATSFTVDNSISIPAASLTKSGSGIGVLPMAFRYPKNTVALSASAGSDFATSGSTFYAAPLTLAAAWQPLDFMEVSGQGGILAGHEQASPFFTGTAKFTWKTPVNNGAFNWGFLARAGGLSKSPYEPYGQDNGGGAGAGIVLGLDLNSFYAGFSSEYTYSASTWKGSEKDSVLRNGAAIQLKEGNFSAAVYGAVNSSLGYTELEKDDRTSSGLRLFRAVEAGFDIQIQPSLSPFYLNIRGRTVHFENKNYFRADAGFTVLL